jgi:hypothetical protein
MINLNSIGNFEFYGSGSETDFDFEVTDFDIPICLYQSHKTLISKFCNLTSIYRSFMTSISKYLISQYFDIEVQ